MRGIILGVFLFVSTSADSYNQLSCDVRAWTETGWVCGLRRWSENGQIYASFRGIPYAKQPIGELRFKELQPPDPWKHDRDSRSEGPVCPQYDEVHGSLTAPDYGMSEACIHVNIHVPIYALPKQHQEYENNKPSERKTYPPPAPLKQYTEDEYLLLEYKHDDDKTNQDVVPPKNQKDYTDGPLNYKLKYRDYAEQNPSKAPNELEKDNGSTNKGSNHEENIHGLTLTYDWLKNDTKQIINSWSNQFGYTVPRFFWPNVEKPDNIEDNKSSTGIKHIVDTWPKYQNQKYETEPEQNLNKHRNKRDKQDVGVRKQDEKEKLLPILVYIHGGGFSSGSGDADMHGPEYLVSKDVIVITFNYRLNVFGFLSLNTSSVPGNNGLRDQIFLLRWVQRNAKNFGGDPDNVTLMGQSAGATFAHILSLSDTAKGLFKRVWMASGTAYQAYYTTSPIYAAKVAADFLSVLGISSTDPTKIHQELVHMPIKRIIEANSLLQAQYGFIAFSPVVESKFPGVETVLDKEPEILIAEGRGKAYPYVIGCTTAEAETFRRRIEYERYVSRIVANPRLNVFGFLSLNTSSVPGNNGLRDQIFLLRWVQRNAKNFGGDPDNVTLMGQSAGATFAHILSLSDTAKGLFKRVWMASGTAYQAYYTTSPIYAAKVAADFLSVLGISSTDPTKIHQELVHMPIKRIIEANSLLQAQYGFIAFSPVVESKFPGVETVLDKEPEILIAEGRGKAYPYVIGCTTAEAETFRRRIEYERYVSRIVANPRLILPAGIPFSTSPNVSLALGEKSKHRYFDKEPYEDGVVRGYSEAGFIYPAFRLARQRGRMRTAPTYLYQFSYESHLNLVQKALKLKYEGTGHIEDLTYMFRVNSLMEPSNYFPPKNRDDMMKDWMSAFVVNFMHCSDPTCNDNHRKSGWPQVTKDNLLYEDIGAPYVFKVKTPTHKLQNMIGFYDKIYAISGSTGPVNETKFIDQEF